MNEIEKRFFYKAYDKYPDGKKVELCEHSVPTNFHCNECVKKSINSIQLVENAENGEDLYD